MADCTIHDAPAVVLIDPTGFDMASVDRICAGCIIKTKDGKILLQQRPSFKSFPHYLGPFGGGLEECLRRGLLA